MKIFVVTSDSKIQHLCILEEQATTWIEALGAVEEYDGRWHSNDTYYEIEEHTLMTGDLHNLTKQSIIAEAFMKKQASREADIASLIRILNIGPIAAENMIPSHGPQCHPCEHCKHFCEDCGHPKECGC